jgi:hypothetical protein
MSDEEKLEYDATTRGDRGWERLTTKPPTKEVQDIETKRISIKAGNVELVLDGTGGSGDRLIIDGQPVPCGNISDIRLEAPCGELPKLFVTRVCLDKGE